MSAGEILPYVYSIGCNYTFDVIVEKLVIDWIFNAEHGSGWHDAKKCGLSCSSPNVLIANQCLESL